MIIAVFATNVLKSKGVMWISFLVVQQEDCVRTNDLYDQLDVVDLESI